MNTHDVLAFALAGETVRRIRRAEPEWATLFSPNVYATSSRAWPMPDFVIVDSQNDITIAGEFKPPNQSKREYLTGLGQAIAYTRDFHYGLLIVPEVAEDDYYIANHIEDILSQHIANELPVGLLRYNPRTISPSNVEFDILRSLNPRSGSFTAHASIDQSFWAKWRDISPSELGLFVEYLYDEGRNRPPGITSSGTIRDRAFDLLWNDMQAGRTLHWGGQPRSSLAPSTKVAWGKNYRNFVTHIGWCLSDGKLTEDGLRALRLVHQYGSDSRLFLDLLARAVLMDGKHLVLINAINVFQDEYSKSQSVFPDEQTWLNEVEIQLDTTGILKRNPGRHAAAVQHSERGFLKAEKTLWRNLELIVPSGPSGGRVYHRGRGFIFDWARITSLLAD